MFSCAPGEAETLERKKLKRVEIGDLISIEGSGAYCSGMSTKNYNSFPEAPEIMIDEMGTPHCIRRRQSLDQIIANELPYKK